MLGCREGDSGSWPMTDSSMWCWLLSLCPSAKENGGNLKRWSSRERCGKEEGRGPVRVSVTCRSFGNCRSLIQPISGGKEAFILAAEQLMLLH